MDKEVDKMTGKCLERGSGIEVGMRWTERENVWAGLYDYDDFCEQTPTVPYSTQMLRMCSSRLSATHEVLSAYELGQIWGPTGL